MILVKGSDVPIIEQGIADVGIVGSDISEWSKI